MAGSCLAAGRLAEAGAAAREGLERATRFVERPPEAVVERILGEIAGRRGDHDAARKGFDGALDIARALDMRPLASRCEQRLKVPG